MTEEIKIQLRIEKNHPLSSKKLAEAILSMDSLLNDFCSKNGSGETELKLENVEKGSDILNFFLFAANGVIPFAKETFEAVNACFDFVNNIKNIKNKSVDEIQNDKMLTKTSLNDIETLTKLAENGVSVTINNYEKCIIVDEKTKPLFEQGIATARKIKNFDAVEQKDFYNVLIKMKEVKDSDRIVKDKAVCDEILPNKSVSAEIIDYEAKELINKNPFDNYYLVDLSVNRIDGVIKLYRIHTLHKIIPKEDLKEENDK